MSVKEVVTTSVELCQSEDPHHPANLIPELCRLFYNLGWVTGTGGGISIRKGDKVYIAPSGVQKERMEPQDLFVMTLQMIDTFNEHLKYMHNERDDKVEFLLNRCATMMSSQEMDELRESIRSLLNHESIERIQVIKLLVKLDNVGADISNTLVAIQLANCYSYDDEHEEMLKNREGTS
ncbi:Putative Methylthioribulose-1-phosphate dehydratase [Rhizopus microsporus]|nr:Putative Methylthioribulose-1-phosphate dehydratase [Rhizopus microsporus]